jgi:hypothetical protein
MKRLLAATAIVFLLNWVHVAKAATLFTNPIIVVTPMTMDFGTVTTNGIATNTFLVENAGAGTLRGKATVASPFKIVDGANYSLRENEAQVITVIYAPRHAGTNIQTVNFTGANGAKAIATGKLSVLSLPKKSK